MDYSRDTARFLVDEFLKSRPLDQLNEKIRHLNQDRSKKNQLHPFNGNAVSVLFSIAYYIDRHYNATGEDFCKVSIEIISEISWCNSRTTRRILKAFQTLEIVQNLEKNSGKSGIYACGKLLKDRTSCPNISKKESKSADISSKNRGHHVRATFNNILYNSRRSKNALVDNFKNRPLLIANSISSKENYQPSQKKYADPTSQSTAWKKDETPRTPLEESSDEIKQHWIKACKTVGVRSRLTKYKGNS